MSERHIHVGSALDRGPHPRGGRRHRRYRRGRRHLGGDPGGRRAARRDGRGGRVSQDRRGPDARALELLAPLPRRRRDPDARWLAHGRAGANRRRIDRRELDEQLPNPRPDAASLASASRRRGPLPGRARAVVRADRAASEHRPVARSQPQQRAARRRRGEARLESRPHPPQRPQLRRARLLRARLPDQRQAGHGRDDHPQRARERRGARHARARRTARAAGRSASPASRPSRSTNGACARPDAACTCARRGSWSRQARSRARRCCCARGCRIPTSASAFGPFCRSTTTRCRTCRRTSSPSTARRSRSTRTSSPGATASRAAPASTWRSSARSPS